MNILAFTNDTGSAQWRLKGPANYINANTEHSFSVFPSKYWTEDTWIPDTNIVIGQMWMNDRAASFVKSKGAKFVYEADDIMIGVNDLGRANLMDMTKYTDISIETYKKADMITTTTPQLADHYRQYNDNVVVLPNYMDFMWWGEPLNIKNYNQIRIGWMGSITHKEDLEMVEPVIQVITEKFPQVKFIYCGYGGKKMLYGDELFLNVEQNRKEYYQGVSLEYWPAKSKTLGMDIGIAPLVDDKFNAGKSPIKYFEYAANGVPGVFSDTVVYHHVVKHGKTGYLAKTVDDWIKYLSKLITDDKFRHKMREKAYLDVINNYNLGDHYQEWINAYQSIL